MSRQVTLKETATTTNIVTTENGTPHDVSKAKLISLQSIVDVNTPSAKTFVAGVLDKWTLNFPAFASVTDREYFVVYDTAGLGWAIYLDKTGSSAVPTGAIYTAIASGRKAKADISGDTTAAQVAARVETAFDALSANPITSDDSAADGHMFFEQTIRGTVTAPASYLLNDAAGNITSAHTTTGIASKVDITADSITIASHGLTTGLKGQTTSTGTLPAGITTGVDYFVISLDANTIQLASSLALAQAGTPLDLTNQGTVATTHTFTPTSVAGATLSLQKSNNYVPGDNAGTWDAVEAATSISADGDVWISDIDPEYMWVRQSFTLTAGRLSASSILVIKEDN